MTKRAFEIKDREKLIEFIMDELIRKGIKSTTMDSLAASLQMSKRTLYEIFSNKEHMVEEALKSFHNNISQQYINIFKESSNIMEAIIKCIAHSRNLMSRANVEFFRDIDDFYTDEKRKKEEMCRYAELEKLYIKGVEQGFFREGLDFRVQCRMLSIQMESLKRMEEIFPKDITLVEAYDAINMGFLRAISTHKGIEYLDNMSFDNNEKN